jgi:hypothetical protein
MTRKPPVEGIEREDNGHEPYDVENDGLASVILVEKADDIASICGRVDTAPTFAVVLHAPDGNRPLAAELGMRRLQRHADDSGKVVAIATPSLSLANRARQVGIPVARRPEHVRWDAPGKRVVRLGRKSMVLPALGIWLQLLAIAAVLVVAVGLALTMAPSVTVRAVPPVETLSKTVQVTASPDFDAIDLAALRVPAQEIQSTRTITLTQRTTGRALVGTQPAKVLVTITNPTDKDVLLAAGVVLLGAPDFIPFLLDLETNVPAGQAVTQQATAQDLGVIGNVAPATVTGWLDPALRELTVTNAEAAAGGVSEERLAVDAADLAALNQLVLELEKSDSLRRLILEERPHDAVFMSTAQTSVEPGKPSALVGTPTDIVLLDVKVQVTALAILEETLEKVALNVLGEGLGVGEFVSGSVSAVESGPAVFNADDNTVSTELRVSGQFARDVTRAAIRDAVKGKSSEDAKSTLVERYGIQEAEVDLSPGWAPWLPRFNSRIDVELVAETEQQGATATETPADEANGTDASATPTPRP